MRPLFFRPPCQERAARRDERLAPLVELYGQDGLLRADKANARLVGHVGSCVACTAALAALRRQREALASLGDVEGAAPTDAGFHRVMAALAEERPARRPRMGLAIAFGAAVVLAALGLGLRQRQLARARFDADEAIVAGAQAAFRRAEHEYAGAVSLLRQRLRDERGAIDPAVEEGARVLAEARERAARLAAERRADPEREALLRAAMRAEVRYYEDALLRVAAEPAR